MAYGFTSSSSKYLSVGSSPVTGFPATIACFANPSAAANQNVVSVGQYSSTHRNAVSLDSGNLLSVTSIGATTNGTAVSATSFSTGSWHHFAGVFSSSSSRQAFLNGVGGTTNTTNVGSQNTADRIAIGARFANSAVGVFFSGSIAEVGIWNVALTADEIASLSKGMTPDKVRPQSLVFYAPLVRDLKDVRGGLTIINNNTATVADHPRVYA